MPLVANRRWHNESYRNISWSSEAIKSYQKRQNYSFTNAYNPNNPIIFPIKQCPIFLRRRKPLTQWVKHLILEGYSAGLNLNCNYNNNNSSSSNKYKITKRGIVELWEKLRQLPVSFISILFIYLGKSIKSFLLKNSFNGDSTIFICAVIFQGSKRNNINNWQLNTYKYYKYL